MNRLVGYVQSAIALVIALCFIFVGIGLLWISFPPEGFDTFVTLSFSVCFLLVGAYGVLNYNDITVGIGSGSRPGR